MRREDEGEEGKVMKGGKDIWMRRGDSRGEDL